MKENEEKVTIRKQDAADCCEAELEKIRARLTGEPDQDLPYLFEIAKNYVDHPFSQEILREIGRMTADVLGPEKTERIIEEAGMGPEEWKRKLDEVYALIDQRELDQALQKAQELTAKVDGMFEDDAVSIYRDFENPMEEVLFNNKLKDRRRARGVSPVPMSLIYYTEGVTLFELGRYQDAEKPLNKALEFNPVSMRNLFEIAEIYKMYNLEKFKEFTIEAAKFAYTPYAVARCARNLGYYFTEMEEWEYAWLFYLYSIMFEDSSVAERELEYILQFYQPPKKETWGLFRDLLYKLLENGLPDLEMLDMALFYGNQFWEEQNYDLAKYFLEIYGRLTSDEKILSLVDPNYTIDEKDLN